MRRRGRAALVTVTALAALLALARHHPGGLGSDPSDPSGAIVSAAAWVAWALVGYLLIAVALTGAGHLICSPAPGERGRSLPDRHRLQRTAPRLAPRFVRRFVDTAVGATAAAVVVTAAAPVAAYADAGPPPSPSTVAAPTLATPLDWPGLARPAAALVSSPARRHAGSREDIVVRAGDSLWTLTARRLGAGASSVQVAAEWPRLYAANRAVIGSNPGLIRPGQRLVPPAPQMRNPR